MRTVQDMQPNACAGGGAQWETCIDAIDKSLLLARDPILFYDEVPLYESELDDNGVSQCIVKACLLHMHACTYVYIKPQSSAGIPCVHSYAQAC